MPRGAAMEELAIGLVVAIADRPSEVGGRERTRRRRAGASAALVGGARPPSATITWFVVDREAGGAQLVAAPASPVMPSHHSVTCLIAGFSPSSLGEPARPVRDLADLRRGGQHEQVAVVVARIVGRLDDEVVAAIGDLAARRGECELGRERETADDH